MKLIPFLFAACSVVFASAQNPVVVELFTSQGCSSCPSADQNLAEIIERAEKSGHQVLGLSFHVDYWNYIGWHDPYSKKEFTERQKEYASHMKLESIYTPQMIVNGRVEFVGSNEKRSTDEISRASKQEMPYTISITDIKKSEQNIVISYSLDKTPADNIINVALVTKNVSNDVTRGENSGRKLAHRNVVQSLSTAAAQKTGSLVLPFSSHDKVDQIIIFMQNGDWQVTGAVRKNF